MPENKLLDISGLSIATGRNKNTGTDNLAVTGVSICVNESETVGIVGESGCGKSLTALSILRLLGTAGDSDEGSLSTGVKITGGSIDFYGTDLLRLTERELMKIRGDRITMVFQDPNASLNPLMRVGAQIAEPLRLHGTPGKEAYSRAREAAVRVGLGDSPADTERILKSYPHQLSGGQRQRVMIARAVAPQPKLIICDEPTTALDVSIQEQILDLLREISREIGSSVLIISHDFEVMRKLARRMYVMYAGRIVECGTSDEILGNPAHEYTRGLIASLPERAEKGVRLPAIPGRVPAVSEYLPGCTFAGRCKLCADKKLCCTEVFPPETKINGDHSVYCHAY